MTKVKCSVDSCKYWGEDQICMAGEIWVRNDISGNPDDFSNHFINVSPVEFGTEMGNTSGNVSKNLQIPLNQQKAQTSPQTCCDTMKSK